MIKMNEEYKTFEELKEELGDKFEEYMYGANINLLNNWKELKKWAEKRIKNANKCLNDPNENWDEDVNGYVLARKFQLEETLKKMQELEQGKDE